jgi:YHS domain-containing protein
MKKIKVVVVFAVMAGILFLGPGRMMATALAAPETKCPILGGDVDKKIYTDYKGQRIYFCCSGCVEKFKSDPEKYLKEMQAAGITPEKIPSK